MIPSLTASQMTEVDRAIIEDYHIELIQMMELRIGNGINSRVFSCGWFLF